VVAITQHNCGETTGSGDNCGETEGVGAQKGVAVTASSCLRHLRTWAQHFLVSFPQENLKVFYQISPKINVDGRFKIKAL
jgi:hypothetical protein